MGDSSPRRGRYCLVLGLGALLIFSACSSGGGSKDSKGKQEGSAGQSAAGDASSTPVSIMNFTFDPKELSVPAGTKVVWTNKDDTPHNVQDLSDLKTPISSDLSKDQVFSITYTKPGSYNYVCGLHSYMTGTVKVT